MSAIWIDAESTTDLNIGPDLLYELRSNVEDILEPYNYIVAPKVQATASSIREKGVFQYDIDLAIETDEPISYHNFPLDSLKADILISNDRVSVPTIRADLANGIVDASAEVRGEEIDLKVTLAKPTSETRSRLPRSTSPLLTRRAPLTSSRQKNSPTTAEPPIWNSMEAA